MKNILLYQRINIFVGLYWWRTKLYDAGSMLSGSALVHILNEEDYLNLKLYFTNEFQIRSVWSAWLEIIGIKEENVDGHKEWWYNQPAKFIEKSGNIEIDDSRQNEYLIRFIKYHEKEFGSNLEKLLNDFDNDPQTQKEWEISWELLMKHWENKKIN